MPIVRPENGPANADAILHEIPQAIAVLACLVNAQIAYSGK